MKTKQIFFTIVCSFALFSACKSSKVITSSRSTETTKKDSTAVLSSSSSVDSVVIYRDRIIVDEVVNEVFIELECDSTGTVKPVNYKTGSSRSFTSLQIKNNRLQLNTKIDSVVNTTRQEFRVKYRQDSMALVRILTSKIKQEIQDTKVITRPPWLLRLPGIALLLLLAAGIFVLRRFKIL